MYMCVKLPLGDLIPCLWPPTPQELYTYEMTITLRLCGGYSQTLYKMHESHKTKMIILVWGLKKFESPKTLRF